MLSNGSCLEDVTILGRQRQWETKTIKGHKEPQKESKRKLVMMIIEIAFIFLQSIAVLSPQIALQTLKQLKRIFFRKCDLFLSLQLCPNKTFNMHLVCKFSAFHPQTGYLSFLIVLSIGIVTDKWEDMFYMNIYWALFLDGYQWKPLISDAHSVKNRVLYWSEFCFAA